MRRGLICVFFFLVSCGIDLKGGGTGLAFEVGSVPESVKQGESFEVIVDVIDASDVESFVETQGEGLEIEEETGSSYIALRVLVQDSAPPGAKTIRVNVQAGGQAGSAVLGFLVEAKSGE